MVRCLKHSQTGEIRSIIPFPKLEALELISQLHEPNVFPIYPQNLIWLKHQSITGVENGVTAV